MSDDFDKEAEREKLREQFEADRQRREATQQMSELLLKGATMTNKHCDACGDPVFRHDGQEFCANCQTAAAEGAAPESQGDASGPAGQPAQRGGTADAEPRRAERASQERADARAEPQARESATDGDDGLSEVPVEAESGGDRRRDAGDGEPRPTGDRRERTPRQESTPDQSRSQPAGTVDADGLEAPAALRRALEKFSRAAANTDDPREAKRHLAAAREAAEALSALRR